MTEGEKIIKIAPVTRLEGHGELAVKFTKTGMDNIIDTPAK